ncbi:hypothetical protein M758_UG171500 [Ceratodon purpureus]|nr:hypothetical protein M758_UG171500 [Ceratodon purpureus]
MVTTPRRLRPSPLSPALSSDFRAVNIPSSAMELCMLLPTKEHFSSLCKRSGCDAL